MDDGRCAGLLLAAGAGTRYGRPKVLAENGAWLRGAVAALRGGGCDPVLVVLGATGPARRADSGELLVCAAPRIAIPAGAQAVWAADWAVGVGASLRTGLRALAGAPVDRVAVLPIDTPDVGADVVARVLAAARDAPTGLARAVFHNQPGHPVVLSHEHWAAVVETAQGNSGARSFLSERGDIVAVTCDDLATGRDHDYPPTPAR
ncbi:NTP transferase domain-containing protein [Nocardia sp. NPDC004068]|uniref:nucleotidyltransferase family protein n=1 Tax=Nocardia sp. NPDC004068 TaxID=3364303 RepID=UPI003673D59F